MLKERDRICGLNRDKIVRIITILTIYRENLLECETPPNVKHFDFTLPQLVYKVFFTNGLTE